MIYLLLLLMIVAMWICAYILGKRDTKIDDLKTEQKDLAYALGVRNNADVDRLRKKYKRSPL